MATIRDPSFWKRFSIAVHRDESPLPRTHSTTDLESSSSSFTPPAPLKTTNSWLERQQKKKSRRTCLCWIFWLGFFGLVAGVVLVVLWMTTAGPLAKGKGGKMR